MTTALTPTTNRTTDLTTTEAAIDADPAPRTGAAGRPIRVGQALPDPRPVSFLRTVQVEIRKMVDTLAGRWLIIITLAIALLAMALLVLLGQGKVVDAGLLFQFSGMPFSILLPVLGIMAATAEWSQRAGLVTFTLEPRRWRVIVARLIAGTVVGLVVVAGTLALAYAVAGVADLFGASTAYGLNVGHTVGFVAALLLSVLQGIAFGFLFLNTAAGIVSILALPMVWQILSGFNERIAGAAEWLDLAHASLPLTESAAMTGQQWTHLATAIAASVLLPLLIGSWRVIRREVK